MKKIILLCLGMALSAEDSNASALARLRLAVMVGAHTLPTSLRCQGPRTLHSAAHLLSNSSNNKPLSEKPFKKTEKTNPNFADYLNEINIIYNLRPYFNKYISHEIMGRLILQEFHEGIKQSKSKGTSNEIEAKNLAQKFEKYINNFNQLPEILTIFEQIKTIHRLGPPIYPNTQSHILASEKLLKQMASSKSATDFNSCAIQIAQHITMILMELIDQNEKIISVIARNDFEKINKAKHSSDPFERVFLLHNQFNEIQNIQGKLIKKRALYVLGASLNITGIMAWVAYLSNQPF